MNERVQELAEQAGYKPLPGFDFANSLEEVFIKKFAELIVRECADIASINQHQYCSVGKYVLEHFGVEDEKVS